MEWKPEQLCNPDGETLAGYYVSEDVKRLWNIELNLAKILLDVCKKHGLRISVAYGSMIGAIRHNGFVPWDDDMDFIMPREDYDKLNALADEEFNKKPGPVVLSSYEHDEHYYKFSLMRICLEGTAFLSKLQSMMDFEYKQSIAIDIYPIERLPDDEKATEKLIKDYLNLSQYMELRHYRRERLWRGNKVYSFYKKYAGEKEFWSDERIYRYLMNEFAKVPNKTRKCANLITYMRYEACSRFDNFLDDEIIEIPFERIKVPCYKSYDHILTSYYGDWRVPVHYPNDHEGYKKKSFIIDTQNSYEKYLKSHAYFYIKYLSHVFFEFLKIAVDAKHVIKLNFLLSKYKSEKVILWGASVFLKNIIQKHKVTDSNNIVGIVDRVQAQIGTKIGKYCVYGLEDLLELKPDVIIVTIVNHNKKFMPEIREYLQAKGLNPVLFVI